MALEGEKRVIVPRSHPSTGPEWQGHHGSAPANSACSQFRTPIKSLLPNQKHPLHLLINKDRRSQDHQPFFIYLSDFILLQRSLTLHKKNVRWRTKHLLKKHLLSLLPTNRSYYHLPTTLLLVTSHLIKMLDLFPCLCHLLCRVSFPKLSVFVTRATRDVEPCRIRWDGKEKGNQNCSSPLFYHLLVGKYVIKRESSSEAPGLKTLNIGTKRRVRGHIALQGKNH